MANTRHIYLLVFLFSFVVLKLLINWLIPDVPSDIQNHMARDVEEKRKIEESKQKAAQGGPGSALKLAKLLEAHKDPPEKLRKYVLRTIDDDDNDLPEPGSGEIAPVDPRDQDDDAAAEEEGILASESWM